MLANVVTSKFVFTDTNHFKQILRTCFTVGSEGPLSSGLREDPVVANWFATFQELNSEQPLVTKNGLSNVIQAATNLYATAVENYLQYGLRDHYVRTLRTLGVADFEAVALRVLKQSVAKRPKGFSFAMTWEDTNAASVVKQEPEREQAIASAVSQERDLMGSISSYNDA